MTTALSAAVPVATIGSVTVLRCAVDSSGNLEVDWQMLDANAVLIGRQRSILPNASVKAVLAVPAVGMLAAAETLLAQLLVSSGSATSLPTVAPTPTGQAAGQNAYTAIATARAQAAARAPVPVPVPVPVPAGPARLARDSGAK